MAFKQDKERRGAAFLEGKEHRGEEPEAAVVSASRRHHGERAVAELTSLASHATP